MAMAYGAKDKKQGGSRAKTVSGNIPADRLTIFQSQGVGFKNELELAPVDYLVRFVVRDEVSGRVGSVSAPITVN
jgi:hypothetical protein